jgi:hypothetical protein
MSDTTTYTRNDAWNRPLEEPPTPQSPLGDIVDHVEDMVAELSYELDPDSGEYEWIPIKRAVIRAFSESLGFPWPKVVAELRSRRYARAAKDRKNGKSEETGQGIPIRGEAFRDLTYDLAPLCPFMIRGIYRADFRSFQRGVSCGSWACERCGPERADGLYWQLEQILKQHASDLFWATARYREGLFSMMGHRRNKEGAEVFWYRDVTGIVTFVSTKPLPGVKEPRVWRPVKPEDLFDELKELLWVPGHQDHGFSPGLTTLATSYATASPLVVRRPGCPHTFDTSGLSEADIARVEAVFNEEAKLNFGVDVASGYFPGTLHADLEKLMEDIIEQVRAAKDAP